MIKIKFVIKNLIMLSILIFFLNKFYKLKKCYWLKNYKYLFNNRLNIYIYNVAPIIYQFMNVGG